jgi:hypothetical protein
MSNTKKRQQRKVAHAEEAPRSGAPSSQAASPAGPVCRQSCEKDESYYASVGARLDAEYARRVHGSCGALWWENALAAAAAAAAAAEKAGKPNVTVRSS